MLDPVEKAIEVQIDGPLVPLGDVALGALDRLVGRVPGAKPELRSEKPGSKTGTSTCDRACWINRSRAVGTPSPRSPPEGFGIVTLRVGCGR